MSSTRCATKTTMDSHRLEVFKSLKGYRSSIEDLLPKMPATFLNEEATPTHRKYLEFIHLWWCKTCSFSCSSVP